ncbi:hypothetical protein [Nonomuraea fuscirosea]|uniref:hypothetical protein n=1 Tax=Nonomuraea fuscirosea TaxID=1291556 RepID=UPI00343CE46C
MTAADVEERIGVPGFLYDLRTQLRTRAFRPSLERERLIPKPGRAGKVRRLGIPVIATGSFRLPDPLGSRVAAPAGNGSRAAARAAVGGTPFFSRARGTHARSRSAAMPL